MNCQLIFAQWGLELSRFRPDLSIAGSPERALKREVLEDDKGACYVLEQLPLEHRESRSLQSRLLRHLAGCGNSALSSKIRPWLPTPSGAAGIELDGAFYQLRRWADGLPLDRERYAADSWRGRVCADFLDALRKASSSPEFPSQGDSCFEIVHYIHHLVEHFRRLLPALVTDITPMIAELHAYGDFERTQTGRFCHGDFHPGNIIWGENEIQAVIDWEFCGRKPAGYDAANLLGCLGMDDPANFTAPFAMTFVKALRSADFLTAEEWHFLPDQIAALRFAWLREWVAQKNMPMIRQELDFIWLVLDNRELLRNRWSSAK